jgi:hypothetical protein
VNGAIARDFFAYDPAFTGGVRVAMGDVNGDRIDDIITGAGPGGGPHVYVYDGATGAVIHSFFPYDPAFTGGVYVAAADFDGDLKADIVTGAGEGGGPHVRVFRATNLSLIRDFFAFEPTDTSGVRVAAGYTRAGEAQVFAASGPGRETEIRIFGGGEVESIVPFPGFHGGAHIALGDFTGAGTSQIVVGADAGGGPHLKVYDGYLRERWSVFTHAPDYRGGIRVATYDRDRSGGRRILVHTGAGVPSALSLFGFLNPTRLQPDLNPYAGFTGGAYVAGN